MADSSFAISRFSSTPASWAIAGRCSMVLVEHPKAISTMRALRNASAVIMSRGLIFFSTSSIIFMPACFARRILSEYTAGIVPFPLSPIPIASVRQFMEFAVYIPEQDPQVGHTFSSYSQSSSMLMVPAATLPTASNIEERLLFLPFTCPANIGPPETKTVGIFNLAAAINRPGTFLSQLGMHTRPSNPCAIAIHSVLSAIRSLVTRLYFMPICPMAIPSQTAIAGNTTGVPPAMATPSFTASAILSRFI